MKNLLELIEEFRNSRRFDLIWKEYGTQIKKIAIVLLMIIIGIAVYSAGDSKDNDNVSVKNQETQLPDESAGTIFVDIGGAVRNPMLAELPEGSRVEDAIVEAGGLTADADISGINRAEFLEDGAKIYIPAFAKDENGNVISENGSDTGNSTGITADGKVNINTADSDTLQTLTGIGPVTADKIIEYRENNGSFSSKEDLKNVSGIGDKTYEKLEDYITI